MICCGEYKKGGGRLFIFIYRILLFFMTRGFRKWKSANKEAKRNFKITISIFLAIVIGLMLTGQTELVMPLVLAAVFIYAVRNIYD